MPKPKKRESGKIGFMQQKPEPQKRIDDENLKHLNEKITSGELFLDKLGINILRVGEKPDVNNGVPRVFMVRDGKVSTLEENGIEIGSAAFWEVANMGQVFAYPAGGQDPVQIQLRWGVSYPEVAVSEPLDLEKGFPVALPKEPESPREPRWYHRLFKFGKNRAVCDTYDRYVRDHGVWKANADAETEKAKKVARTIQNAYGERRLLFSNRSELTKAEEARRDFAETRALKAAMDKAKRVAGRTGETERAVKNALSIYQPEPELRDKWLKKDPNDPNDKHRGKIYTKQQFGKLTAIHLTDDLKIGPEKVSPREFGALALFATKEPDIGMATQNVNGDPQPVVDALTAEKFTEAEAKDMITISASELTTRSILQDQPRSDTGNYIATSIQPARERALLALQEHRDGNSTRLAGILARMVSDVGRTDMSNNKFSENLLGQNKMAAELIDMMHRDPGLEEAVRREYERTEEAFHRNHPQYVKPLGFDEQVKVIRGIQKMDTIQEDCIKAQKKLLDARIKGKDHELSEAEKKSCVRNILKCNLFTHQYASQWDAASFGKGKNGQLLPNEHLDNFYAKLQMKYPAMALSSRGGSSTPVTPSTVAYTALTTRVFPKGEVLDVLANPKAMEQVDNALDELIVREGMDKASSRQLADQLVMKEFSGQKVEKMLNDGAKNREKQDGRQMEINGAAKDGPGHEEEL